MTRRITKKNMPVGADELRQTDDARYPAIVEALDWMEENHVLGWRPGPFQLKVGSVNYYPTSGKITLDHSNGEALQRQTLKHFVSLIEKYCPDQIGVLRFSGLQ